MLEADQLVSGKEQELYVELCLDGKLYRTKTLKAVSPCWNEHFELYVSTSLPPPLPPFHGRRGRAHSVRAHACVSVCACVCVCALQWSDSLTSNGILTGLCCPPHNILS